MAVDFRENGEVEFSSSVPQETYSLLIEYARETGLTLDQTMQQILTVALKVDKSMFSRLAEADRLREEAEAKLAEMKALVASYEHRISWFTACENCATILDSSIKETERAVKAEASLAEAEALLEKYRKRMAGGDERTHQIVMELLAATEGPYWYDEDENCFRFHGVGVRIPASEHLGEQTVNKQIFKAPKRGTDYMEYWPDEGDKVFLTNSWSNVAFLLTELQHTKSKIDFLLKMPRRIQSAIGLACPMPDEKHTTDCDYNIAAVIALKVGKEMRDELRAMDEIEPVEPS